MWTPARIAFYLTSLLAGAGTILAMFGLATYDPVAQTIDLHPISIPMVVGLVAPVAASALAAVAAFLGWGRK
jgi:multisubunit Na+/H+ antiporter MnhG subunit